MKQTTNNQARVDYLKLTKATEEAIMSHKFWIVEYVDVNAPKVERSEICCSKSEARHRAAKREAVLHYETLENFADAGLCDYILNAHIFDNVEVHA